jgi:hypothetical protein
MATRTVLQRREGYAELPRGLDGGIHREGAADLAHGVSAVHDDGAGGLRPDTGPPARVHSLDRQLPDVVGHPNDSVRMHAPEIRCHQRLGEEHRVRLVHPGRPEDRGAFRLLRWRGILQEHFFLPGDLDRQFGPFIACCDTRRSQERLGDIAPPDVHHGRRAQILTQERRSGNVTRNRTGRYEIHSTQ